MRPSPSGSSSTQTRLARTLHRIAHEIIEANAELESVALIGIHTRGVPLAHRLRRLIEEFSGVKVDLGTIDITFHRDDLHVRGRRGPLHAQPLVRETKLDFALEGRTCILVDDVLYSGRTIRAAIEALFDYGRPARVQLAVVADAGTASCRSAPTMSVRTCPPGAERVQVQLVEIDEIDRVLLVSKEEPMTVQLVRDDLLPPSDPPPRRHLISIDDLDPRDVGGCSPPRAPSSARWSGR